MDVFRELRKGPITINGVEWPVDGGDISLVGDGDVVVTAVPGPGEIHFGRDLALYAKTLAGIPWAAEGGDINVVAEDDIEITADPATRTLTIGRAVVLEGEWQIPTFQNLWADYGAGFQPGGYYLAADNRVYLRGAVTGGGVADDTTGVIFTLPPGFRPPFRTVFSGHSEGEDPTTFEPIVRQARIDVLANGEVLAVDGENILLSLSQVNFRAA